MAHPDVDSASDGPADLVVVPPEPGTSPALPPAPAIADVEVTSARAYVERSRAASTRRAYEKDWERFGTWCRERGADSLPTLPALVAVHLSALADAGWHRLRWVVRSPQSPTTGAKGWYCHTGPRAAASSPRCSPASGGRLRHPRDREDPACDDVALRLIWSIECDGLAALRDRAVVTFGVVLAARRSELVALDVADLAWEGRSVRITLRRLRAARLSDHSVACIVQARAAAGLDPARFGGTRSGQAASRRRPAKARTCGRDAKSPVTRACRCSQATCATRACSRTTRGRGSCK